MNSGKEYRQKGRIRPRILDDLALSEAIRTKAKVLRERGVKVKFDIGKMSRKRKVGFNGELDKLMLETLKRNKGNIKKTAEELGIARSTVYNKLKLP